MTVIQGPARADHAARHHRRHDRRDGAPAARGPGIAGDQFVRGGAGGKLGLPDRERLATRLVADMEKLSWATNPAEKMRLLATIADLKVDAAVPVVTREFTAAIGGLSPGRQMAMAKLFYGLVPPAAKPGDAAISPGARDAAVAFMVKEFNGRSGDVHHILGYGLGLSRTDDALDAIIKDYQAHPAQGGTTLNKPLMVLSYCPEPKVADFLLGEYERLAGNEEARMQVLEALQAVLKDDPG